MGLAVVTVASGGMPVVDVTAVAPTRGLPVTEATNGYGVPVTKVVGKPGLPVVFETIGASVNDPAGISNVKLLMGFNGANGSKVFTDESPSARGSATWTSAAALDTSQFKFGVSSFNNGGGVINYPDSADWILASSNSDQYTVECWVRFVSIGANKVIIAQYATDGTVAWTLQSTAIASELQFSTSPSGTFAAMVGPTSSGAGITTGVWYHLAADKDATGKMRLYKNGVMIASATPANSAVFNSNQPLGIGATSIGAGFIDGWIDELRITKGVARYASDAGFAVPTAAFPRS